MKMVVKKNANKSPKSGNSFSVNFFSLGKIVAILLSWSFLYTQIVRSQGTNPRTLGVVLMALPVTLLLYLVLESFIKKENWTVSIAALLTPVAYNGLNILIYGSNASLSFAEYLPVAVYDLAAIGVGIVIGLLLFKFIEANWPKKWYIK